MKTNGFAFQLPDYGKLIVQQFVLRSRRYFGEPIRVAEVAPSVVVAPSGDGMTCILDAEVDGVGSRAVDLMNLLIPSLRARLS